MLERLCFGTFIDVLIQCKKENTNKSFLTTTIIKTIDPEQKYDTNASRALNHLYKCTGDFVDSYSNIKDLAPKTERAALVEAFTKDVIPLLDIDKYELGILALCDIIKKDITFDYENNGSNVKKFQHYIGKDIKDFINVNEWILPEFLTDIFRYTIIEVKNTVGKEWLKKICDDNTTYEKFFVDYVNSFQDKRDTIRVWINANQKSKEQSVAGKDDTISQSSLLETIIDTSNVSQDMTTIDTPDTSQDVNVIDTPIASQDVNSDFQDDKDDTIPQNPLPETIIDTPNTSQDVNVIDTSNVSQDMATIDMPNTSQDVNVIDTSIASQDMINNSQNHMQILDFETLVPVEYHICDCCEYFKSTKTVHKNIIGKSGKCNLYEIIVKSIDGTNCEHFLANATRILLMELQGK